MQNTREHGVRGAWNLQAPILYGRAWMKAARKGFEPQVKNLGWNKGLWAGFWASRLWFRPRGRDVKEEREGGQFLPLYNQFNRLSKCICHDLNFQIQMVRPNSSTHSNNPSGYQYPDFSNSIQILESAFGLNENIRKIMTGSILHSAQKSLWHL